MADDVTEDNGLGEQVAFKLMQKIAHVEGKNLDCKDGASRKWILRTYDQCRSVVRGKVTVDQIIARTQAK